MKRSVKAWVVVNVLYNGRVWEGSTSTTRGKAMKAFVANTEFSWDEWRDVGWRVVPCVVTYDDGRPSRSGAKRTKGGRRG